MYLITSIAVSNMDIQNALVKFNYTEPTTEDFAKHAGFKDNEIDMLKIFWDPIYNEGWMYLSPTIIIDSMGYKQISHFYKDTLKPNYKENIDYKEVDKNHDLVKIYNEFLNEDQSSLGKSKHTGGKAQKYYIITGESYKKMLMKCKTKKGESICEYYLKVEKLANLYNKYTSILHKYISMENAKQLEEKSKELNEQKNQMNRMNKVNLELLTYKKQLFKNEIIYIVSSYHYVSQGIFKVGRTTCMKSRLSGHNNTHITGDKFKVLHEFKVNDATSMEAYIHKKLRGLIIDGEKEFFLCPFDLLENVIDIIINNDIIYNNTINTIIDTVLKLRIKDYNANDWMRNIKPDTFNEEMQLIIPGEPVEIQSRFDITNATEIQKEEFIKKCIDAYKETIVEPNQLAWKLIQPILKNLLKQNDNPIRYYRAKELKSIYQKSITETILDGSSNDNSPEGAIIVV